MKIYATKCKNCKHSKKVHCLSGMTYVCLKYNKRVNKNYYCGNVPAITVEGDL